MKRITVNLPTNTENALAWLTSYLSMDQTETVSRAIMMTHFLLQREKEGEQICLRTKDGTVERVHFL